MIVRLKDGTEYTEGAFTHPGHPRYMLTRDEFKERFRLEQKISCLRKKQKAPLRASAIWRNARMHPCFPVSSINPAFQF